MAKGKHMDNVKVSMAITVDGTSEGHDFPVLTVKEAKQLGDHLLDHAQKQIMHAWPEDSAQFAGPRKVGFEYIVSMDGNEVFGQSLRFGSVNDQAVDAMRGIFDGAMAKLDKRLAAKAHRHNHKASA